MFELLEPPPCFLVVQAALFQFQGQLLAYLAGAFEGNDDLVVVGIAEERLLEQDFFHAFLGDAQVGDEGVQMGRVADLLPAQMVGIEEQAAEQQYGGDGQDMAQAVDQGVPSSMAGGLPSRVRRKATILSTSSSVRSKPRL